MDDSLIIVPKNQPTVTTILNSPTIITSKQGPRGIDGINKVDYFSDLPQISDRIYYVRFNEGGNISGFYEFSNNSWNRINTAMDADRYVFRQPSLLPSPIMIEHNLNNVDHLITVSTYETPYKIIGVDVIKGLNSDIINYNGRLQFIATLL